MASGNDAAGAGIAHLRYRPPRLRRAAHPDVALIGKGILFDTGGINLKTHRSMLDMHTDMAGSAVALATLIALAELRAPLAADAWLAITENRIGPHAYKPQEVVTAANGVTIQVIHTDAEGPHGAGRHAGPRRAYPAASHARLRHPHRRVRLCPHRAHERRIQQPAGAGRKLESAGRASGERVWNFPFEADYDAELESKIADIVQCAMEGKGDHIYGDALPVPLRAGEHALGARRPVGRAPAPAGSAT